MKYRSFFLLLACLFLLPNIALSDGRYSGTSAADFLKIGVGARAAGLGEAFVAIADDATGAYWNAAGLASLSQSQITFMHNEWLSDLRYEYLSYAMPYQQRGSLAMSISFFSMGEFSGYDISGNPSSDFSAHDWSALVAYGHRLTPQFSVGGALKYVQQKIADEKAGAFAGDLGALYDFQQFSLGMSMRNLGSKVTFIDEAHALPLTFDLGVAYRGFTDRILLAADLEVPRDNSVRLKHGIEYNHEESFFLRMGYNYRANGSDFGGASGLSLGAGFLLNSYHFDYTFSPNADLGDAHRISFTFNFGPTRGL
jgi:long-subunit fatty acid transport protein